MFNAAFFGGLFFVLLSCFLLYKKLEAKRLLTECQLWPSTKGTMTTSEASKYDAKSTRWDFMAVYEYEVDGQAFKNSVVTLYTISNKDEAQSLAKKYPLGKEVKVYYNPRKPQQSLLEKGNGNRKPNSEIHFAIIGIVIGALVMTAGYLGWFNS
jgi:hypothetical protein